MIEAADFALARYGLGDWKSIAGILARIFGMSGTQISYTTH